MFSSGSGGFLQPEKVVQQFGISADMKVADFGCGHGYFTIPIAKILSADESSGGKIYAIDILKDVLDNLKKKAESENLIHIEYILANLEATNSSLIFDEAVDFVLMANTLFQSQKKENIIREAKRMLRLGGKLAIIDWDPTNLKIGSNEDGWRISKSGARELAEKNGFVFERDLDAGAFHYGLILKRAS